MPKLNDTQTILLSAAAQRDSGSLYPLPDTLAEGGARVTKALAGLTGGGWAEERETDVAEYAARSNDDARFGIFITAGGLAAIGLGDPLDPIEAPQNSAEIASTEPKRPTSKSTAVIELLQREDGASLADLLTATGWLPHTTRAALTGLRKKGHAIERFKRDDQTCYRIEAAA